MCQLYIELVVHQLKIHKLEIQNVTKVSEVIPSQMIAAMLDSFDSDTKRKAPLDEIEPADEAVSLYESDALRIKSEWSKVDANSNQSSDEEDNNCDDKVHERTTETQTRAEKKCYKCNKSFASPRSLHWHLKKWHNMSSADALEYVSFQCEEKAPRKSRMYDNPVSCTECNITFVRSTTLRTHYARVHRMNVEELNKHVPKRRRRNPDEIRAAAEPNGIRKITATQCYLCKERFERVPALFEHFYRIHEPAVQVSREGKRVTKPSLVCSICEKEYKMRYKLHAHLITVHGLTEGDALTKSKQVEPIAASEQSNRANDAEQLLFVCEICQRTHSERHALRQHIIRSHELCAAEAWEICKGTEPVLCPPYTQFMQQWICYVCKKPLATKISVQRHLERFHPIENAMSTIVSDKAHRIEPKECHTCHKKFQFEFSLRCHLQRYHNTKRSNAKVTRKSGRTFPCKHCDVTFNRAWKLDEHIKSLKKGNSIMCKKCYVGFDNRAQLVQHMEGSEKCRKTPTAKTALCNYCGESFVNNTALAAHIRRHLNVRPFECDKCDQKFFTCSQLQRHQHAHVTEPQSFPCLVEGCGKTYLRLSYLQYHEKQKHSEPTLKCPHCDEMFTTERYRE